MEIFKSKRFWTMVVGLAAMVLTAFVPQLAEHIDVIIPAILGIIGILIGGYTVGEVANANAHERAINPPKS